jgi:RHS repeat-associated protein
MPRFLRVPLLRCLSIANTTLIVILIVANLAIAQTYTPDDQAGFQPHETHSSTDIDTVNLGGGNLTLHIPLLSYPQRGALHLSFELVYNGKLSQSQEVCGVDTCNPVTYLSSKTKGPHFGGGAYLHYGVYVNQMSAVAMESKSITFYYPQRTYYKYSASILSVNDGYGSSHILGNTGTQFKPPTGGTVSESGPWRALDGTGWKLLTDRATIVDPDGVVYSNNAITDSNGNYIQYGTTSVTDTLGRIIPNPPSSSSQSNTDSLGCTGPLPVTLAVSWTPPGYGGPVPYKFCYASVQVEGYGCGLSPTTMLQSVVLPNLTTYTFEYNDNNPGCGGNYGSLTKITLPTGGTISYTYVDGVSSTATADPFDQSTTTTTSRWVASRTVADETGSQLWNYSYGGTSVIVTDPDKNDTVHQFVQDYAGTTHETGVLYYQGSSSGSGVRLKNIQTAYLPVTQNTTFQGIVNYLPGTRTTTLENGQMSKEVYTYDSGFTFRDIRDASVIALSYGKVVSQTSYDYGASTVLKQTTTSYKFQNDNNYLNANMLNLPASVVVSNGTYQCSETDYGYDDSGRLYTPNPPITTQHGSPPNSVRGNLTSVQQQLSSKPCQAGASWTPVTSYSNMFDTGEAYQKIDPLGNATTFTYDPAFVGSLVTTTQLPDTNSPSLAHHVTNDWYDFNTGLKTSHTGENGPDTTTTYAYDSMRRITQITYPAGGGSTTYTYTDTGSPNVEIRRDMGSGKLTDEFILLDNLGREISDSKANGETNGPYDKVDTCYNDRGQKSFVSYPYQSQYNSAQRCSGLGDSYSYDALGRVMSVAHSDGTAVTSTYSGAATSVSDEGNGTRSVQKISQTDALGRLISACEMTGQALQFGLTPNPAPQCNSFISGSGFPTTYQYDALGDLLNVSQGGLNARTFSYDSLSRLLTASNPESGTICYGTWSGGYGTTCTSGYDAAGRLTKRTMLKPNQTGTATLTTTYQYDALGRLLSKTYSDGVTPGAYYYYDQVSAFGQGSLTYTTGRLSSEETNNGSSINSSVYSYDRMGRTTTDVQNVPTAYTQNYGYNLIGEPTSISNGLGVTFTPSYNTGTRLQSYGSSWSDSSHPASMASNISYSAWGSPVSTTFGNGVSESRTYYPRGWLQTLTETGMIYSAGTAGSGSITVSGGEGSNAQGSAVVTITGSEQNRLSQPATQSQGHMTITGSEHCTSSGNSPCLWDTGTVDVWVNGYDKSVQYGHLSTAGNLASALASLFQNDPNSPVTATSGGGTIYFMSRAYGSGTNYQIVGQVTSDTNDFSFLASPVNMTGGQDAVYVYDAGTVNLTVGSYPASASFDNNTNNSATRVASALAASLNGSTIVTATASGANVTITSKAYGANADYALTPSSSSSQGFNPPSFGVSTPGALSGGRDPAGSQQVYDAGTASVTVNNYPAQASYGQSSTPTNVASGLASAISNSPNVTASNNGSSTITITARTSGSNTNYAVSESLTSGDGFSPPSFALGSLGALSGGSDPGNNPGTIYSLSLGYAPNGDVQSANDSANGNWTYVYDDMNRLITSTCGSGCTGSYGYGYAYAYDRFGNRWQQQVTGGSGYNVNYSFDANNRIIGGSYDSAGNLTNDGFHSYAFDAENRIIKVDGGATTYVYDAEGRRTSKTTGGVTLDYFYDRAGHQVAEVTSGGTVNRQEIYAGGSHVGTYTAGTTFFHHADWLGTERTRSNMAAQACETISSLPFGDGQMTGGNCGDPSPMHFTGKQRDAESNLDDFPARYYSSPQARWLTPDWSVTPAPVPYVKLGDPQTLNLYAYVGNDPTNHSDPDGHLLINGIENSLNWRERSAESGGGGAAGLNVFPSIDPSSGEDSEQSDSAQNQSAADTPAPQPAPTDPKGNPTPPPVPVPGAPEGTGWKWNPDPQNPRGGTWGPDGWKGPNPPRGSWDPDGHWDIDKGDKSPRGHYDPKGNPITPGTAHPGNAPTTMMDRMKSITPGPILKWGTAGVVIYIIIDEGSRLYPPRNLVPVP